MKSKHSIVNNEPQVTNEENIDIKHDSSEKSHVETQGPHGVDKDPAEDAPGPPGSDNKDALKGKKVDGDPENPGDQPLPL